MAEVKSLLERARGWPEWSEREAPFDVALPPDATADLSHPDGVDTLRKAVERTSQAGATVIQLSLTADSLAHYLDQLEIFSERVVPEFV